MPTANPMRKILALTATVVIVLGVAVVVSLVTPPANTTWAAAAKLSAPARAPAMATIDPPGNIVDQSLLQTTEAEIPCQGQIDISSAVKQVRLKGKLCGAAKTAIKKSEVYNPTNGYTGMVFQLAQAAFTTDYVALARGENKVQIIITLEDGAIDRREITINRKN